MNILFLGYWNVDDPLTSATILPHLKILRRIEKIDKILFVNTQREPISEERAKEIKDIGVVYKPIFSKNLPVNILNKLVDFVYFPRVIAKLVKKYNIHLIIARAAPAGGLAYLAWKKCKVPFVVESFEPHAAYMLAAKVWSTIDPRYLYQGYLEKKQKKYAQALITVSHNYRLALKAQGISENKLLTAPCAVDAKKFYPDKALGRFARGELNIPENAVVGVYAGKFGGLYYENEAFKLFKAASLYYKNFCLLLLSSHDKDWVRNKLKEFELPEEACVQLFVSHQEMNKYLNAADFAFAPIRKLSVSAFQSPVKTGEYWSVGLPVLMTNGIGDEAQFIEKEGLGFCIDPDKLSYEDVFIKLDHLLNDMGKMGRISKRGVEIRNYKFTYSAYVSIIQA